jgi:hypothetical protein
MTMSRSKTALLFAATFLCSNAATAGTVILTLNRASLINVVDAAGTSQHEAGVVKKGAATVGNYFLQRRVETLVGGLFNTGATHITLLFAPKPGTSAAPDNVTIDGAHDFTSGAFKGSVGATSSAYSWLRDADATYTAPGIGVESLVIQWTGSNQLTLP